MRNRDPGPGDILGEAAILNHQQRNASILTKSRVGALHFTDDAPRRLGTEMPVLREALAWAAADRLGTSR